MEEDPSEGSLTKVPPQRDPEYLAKLKTKTDAIIAISEDTLQLNALRRIRSSLRNLLKKEVCRLYLCLWRCRRTPIVHSHSLTLRL